MSVAGIDVGDAASCIALARKGGEVTRPADSYRSIWLQLPGCSLRALLHCRSPSITSSAAGVDVLLNKESNRETPSVVTFTAKQRQLGTDAGASPHRGAAVQRAEPGGAP